MKNENKKEESIKSLSRIQTAKIRQNLEKVFLIKKNKNQKSKLKLNIDSDINNNYKRPMTSYHNNKLSQLYLPPAEIKSVQQIELIGTEEYQKAHLNEVNIQNLFTEKLWEKNNLEKNEDYTKKLAYKKLIMRAKLLKAMKTNIVLKKKEFDEYNNKYYKGIKLLSAKLKKRKFKTDQNSSESFDEINERPNFISIKNPDIFSEYEYTSLFQDYFCTPIELIKKIFNYDEQKIIKLDPIFFRFNREPFIGVQKNIGFSLKDKINEEDRIAKQKIEKIKELNKRFIYLQKRHNIKNAETEKKENKKEFIKEKNSNENFLIKSKTKENFYFPNNDKYNKKNKNKQNEFFFDFFPFSKKNKFTKKRLNSKKNKSGINNFNKKDINLNINTNYNVFLEIKKNKKKKKQVSNYIYSDEEKIKDKKKKLSMSELFEMYKERKKLYLDDMSYNRKKNKYKFEQLRIKKNEENLKEFQQKENLRKILTDIEDNYKLYQK